MRRLKSLRTLGRIQRLLTSSPALLTGCLAGFIVLAGSARGQDYDPDWANHFRVGAMVGLNIKANFKLGGNLSINHPAGVYDDGYVHPPPPGSADDYTSNWGYNNANQISGQNLLMHDTTSFSPSSGGSANKDALPLAGFELAYGGNLWYWGRARIGWDAGFGLLPINLSVNESALGNVNQSIFSFDTGGINMPRPGYQGSTGPGYSIHSTRTLVGTTNIPNVNLTGSQTLDVILYTFRLGPSVYWDFNKHLGMSMSAGPALGVVSGNLKFDETVSLNSTLLTASKGQIDGTDLVYGGYVNASLMYHVVRNGDFFIGAQYMPLGNATISGQGHEGRLKLGGAVYLSAGINWPF